MAKFKQLFVQRNIGGKAKKIWEIRDGFQCSVIGTCFSDDELMKINQKKDVSGGHFASSYELHNRFVRFAQYKNAASEAMQKILERKYRIQVSRFHKLKTDEEIRALWQIVLVEGDIAAAYWAVCSHPSLAPDLLSDFFGDVHMASHASVRSFTKMKKKSGLLLREKEQLQVTHEQLEVSARDAQSIMQQKINELEETLLKERTEKKTRDQSQTDVDRSPLLFQENFQLQQVVTQSQRELSQQRSYIEYIEKLNEQLEKNNSLLQTQLNIQEDEMVALETSVERFLEIPDCHDCEKLDTAECPGKKLCGKRVLYVGGMHKMVPHYRSLVEKNGGEFLHHDGGREESKHRLPSMLVQADAVVCPIDCVSHAACLIVKKICKQYQKPYVMMRSSGLSSLASGLEKIPA